MSESRTRDGDATRSCILTAAEELFAERGFARTSLTMISERSGASGPLILFHFKDKKGLYQAVKAAVVERYAECLRAPIEHDGDFPSLLHSILNTMFLFYKNNLTMVRMSYWGRLEGDTDPWPGESEWHHRYTDMVRRAQEKGVIRADISPFRALVMITGTIHMWWEYREHLLHDLGQLDDPEAGDELYFADLEAVLLRGLTPQQPSQSSDTHQTAPNLP